MRRPWKIGLVLAILTGPSIAQSYADHDKPCLQLYQDMQTYYEEHEGQDDTPDTENDPARRVVNAFLSDLQGDARLRIYTPFEYAFLSACVQSEESRNDETITVGLALGKVMTLYSLDRSAPLSGLIEIPKLDVHQHSMKDFSDAVAQLSHDEFRNPMNDPLLLAMKKYFQKYHLVTKEDYDAAGRVAISLSYEASSDDEPLAPILDRLAAHEGLRLR